MVKVVRYRTVRLCCTHYLAHAVSWLTRTLAVARRCVSPSLRFAEEQSILADKVAVLRQILRERPQDRNALEEEIEWESTARRQAVYYARPGPQRENHR